MPSISITAAESSSQRISAQVDSFKERVVAASRQAVRDATTPAVAVSFSPQATAFLASESAAAASSPEPHVDSSNDTYPPRPSLGQAIMNVVASWPNI